MRTLFLSVFLLASILPATAFAHCPLCTAGAGVLAVLAASLGVSSIVVGVLIGAFALALSVWISGMVKKQYVPYQTYILALIIFLGTVIPIMPLIQHYGPLYVPFIGEYGTTYTINLYVLGVIVGSLLMLLAPLVSRLVATLRGGHAPFQGILITLTMLVAVSVIIQLLS